LLFNPRTLWKTFWTKKWSIDQTIYNSRLPGAVTTERNLFVTTLFNIHLPRQAMISIS